MVGLYHSSDLLIDYDAVVVLDKNNLIFIFWIVWLVSSELSTSWIILVLMKNWIVLSAVCLKFSSIRKIYRLRYWVWRWMLGIIKFSRFVFDVASIRTIGTLILLFGKKNIVIFVSKVVTICKI